MNFFTKSHFPKIGEGEMYKICKNRGKVQSLSKWLKKFIRKSWLIKTEILKFIWKSQSEKNFIDSERCSEIGGRNLKWGEMHQWLGGMDALDWDNSVLAYSYQSAGPKSSHEQHKAFESFVRTLEGYWQFAQRNWRWRYHRNYMFQFK